MTRRGATIVAVKLDIHEVGIGTAEAALVWESEPTGFGELAHLSVGDGDLWRLSITDMEEARGSYMSVQVSREDLRHLRDVLGRLDF